MAKIVHWHKPLIYYTYYAVSGVIAGIGLGIAYANLFPLSFEQGMAITIVFGILNIWIWNKLGIKKIIMKK